MTNDTPASPQKPKKDRRIPGAVMGRPQHVPDEKTRLQVKLMAAMGTSVIDIGKVVGISHPTVQKHYMAELETGHIEANAKVAQSLYQQATHRTKPNVTACIFWLKCRAGWREDQEAMGKKEMAELLAKVAQKGTDWEKLLTS